MHRRNILLAALLPLPALAQSTEYQFLRAEYGTNQRRMDVSAAIGELVQRRQSAQVGNALFGNDPAPGQFKRLRVTARDRRGRERSFDYAEDSWFDASRFGLVSEAQGWRILQARYGVSGANVDVTQRLRELARGEQRLLVSNEVFGVDPAPGVPKTLRITARDGSGRRRSFEFAEGSWVDGQQFAGWRGGDWGEADGGWDAGGPTRPPAGLFIEQAEYAADDGRRLDLTQLLQDAAARSGRLDLVVNNRTLGGDPAPGVPKRLWLRWRLNGGRVQEGSWREGERLRLP